MNSINNFLYIVTLSWFFFSSRFSYFLAFAILPNLANAENKTLSPTPFWNILYPILVNAIFCDIQTSFMSRTCESYRYFYRLLKVRQFQTAVSNVTQEIISPRQQDLFIWQNKTIPMGRFTVILTYIRMHDRTVRASKWTHFWPSSERKNSVIYWQC